MADPSDPLCAPRRPAAGPPLPTIDPAREEAELREYLGGAYDHARLEDWQGQLEREAERVGDEQALYRTSEAYLYNLTAFAMTATKEPYLRDLAALVPPPARVLDYGCGIGSDGLTLAGLGYEVAFADFANPSVRYLRWRLGRRGLAAAVHDLDQGPPPGGFDVAFAFDVIEHVDDPFALLARLEALAELVVVNFLAPGPAETSLHRELPIAALLDHARARGLRRYRRYHGRSHLVAYAPRRSGRAVRAAAGAALAAGRPGASVIVPFAGPQARLEEILDRLGRLARGPADEIVVVDNRSAPARPGRTPGPGVRVLEAPARASSWHARDVGAAATTGDWLVFVDADTRPVPDLLDRYLDPPPGPDVGVLAGGVRDWDRGASACSRYVSDRAKMDQAVTLAHPYLPYAQTANCAVRRAAFDAVGGSPAGAGSSAAGDADLCWRLQQARWRLESRPAALVEHENRDRFRDLFGQLARHGAGLAWLERRHPGSAPPPTPRELIGRLPHYVLAAARAPDPEQALFALADLACLYARDVGRLRGRDL